MKIDWKSRQTRGILALELATLAVYVQTAGYGFVTFDDAQYVYENPVVNAGLTTSGAAWAFTTFTLDNWHPLTWLSYMLDCQLFGPDAGAYHLVNVALHMGSTLLLFLALARMTRQPWRSALAAGIFALHPLHVESVAWIAERKDVLSGFFAMLTLLLYARYAEAPTVRRYVPMALALALGLLAKPMLVTFPFVLLLMDFWPLRRCSMKSAASSATGMPAGQDFRRLLWEKTPLLAMAAASGLLTLLAQTNSDQRIPLALLSLPARLANAATACVTYLEKAFWPTDLAVLYPYHPQPAGSVLTDIALLVAVTLAALASVRRCPYLLVGWLWYLGMLVPVSGIVQNGAQSMADRYMYLPLVGLSLAVVWGGADLVAFVAGHSGGRLLRGGGSVMAVVALLLLAAGAHHQAGYWKDSRTLYAHTLAVTTGNVIIHDNLGAVLSGEGMYKEAIKQYREAIALLPDYATPHGNLGKILLRQPGRLDEAIVEFTEAARLKPGGDPEAQNNLCFAFYKLGRLDEAVLHCKEALRLKPDYLPARSNLGLILALQGKNSEAAVEYTRVLAADPDFPGVRARLENLNRSQKDVVQKHVAE